MKKAFWGIAICLTLALTIKASYAEEGIWDSTKNVASDTWSGTKEVTSDVWDGTKKVTSDVWDGTKKVATDVKDGLTPDKSTTAAPSPKPAQNSTN